MRVDYPLPFIYKLLENYDNLADGRWFENDYGEKRRTSSAKAPFEAATIAKADIDTAMAILCSTEREVITRIYIEGFELEDVENRLHINVSRCIKTAVREMGNYLNGECVLRRWASENGFINRANRSMVIPEDLPREIDQFLKEICIYHCVTKSCPK